MNFVGGLLIVLVICVLFASFTKVGQTSGLSTIGWNVVRVVCVLALFPASAWLAGYWIDNKLMQRLAVTSLGLVVCSSNGGQDVLQ